MSRLNRRLIRLSVLVCAVSMLAACPPDEIVDDDDTTDDDDAGEVPSTYAFEGTVSYGGQTFRHVLIASLKDRMGGMTERLQGGWSPSPGDVVAELERYFRYTADWAGNTHGVTCDPAPEQTTLGDFGSTKALVDKIAGQDPDGQHVEWATAGIVGWPGNPSPLDLMDGWFEAVDDLAQDWVNGDPVDDPDGRDVTAVFLDGQGLDHQQLIQKFLLGAVAFSQATDDYLDDDFEGKGLLSSHTDLVAGEAYTELEHAWDEAFGYFGAARDYSDYTDDEIADGITKDTDGSGGIDLAREKNHGHSVNAGKRDRLEAAAVDFTGDAWDGFTRGRALLAATAGNALSVEQIDELKGHRDRAVQAWESALAATVVHYINEVLQDRIAAEYDYAGHAKHWSELKGFALALQFNRRSPLGTPEFAAVHSMIGDAPALPGDATWDAHAEDLRDARTILGAAYGFAAEALGDEDGVGGW